MIPESSLAGLAVLSVGDGDMKFNFDEDNPQETARAQRCIEDMLRRGYSIFVEVGGKLVKAKGFDPKTNSYVIAGVMCPTDDVMAHLLMMRADERKYWSKANQHPLHAVNAGI